MKIELKPVDSLIPYIRNPRVNQKAVPKVKSSIKEFGFRQPIVVDTDNVIVVGHTRWLAAKELGIKEVPVHVADSLTPSQIQAYRIADNRTNQDSSWDEELLKIELIDLKASGFNLELTGFEAKELCGYVAADKPSEDDDCESVVDKIEECQQKWNVQLGDLFQCGNHRILCGDSTKEEDVARVLMDDKPNLMVTDPPYGVEYDASWRDEAAKTCPSMGNRKDSAKGVVKNDDRADWSEAWKLFTGDIAYVWHGGTKAAIVAESLISSGLELRSQIIWAKNNLVIGRGNYHPKHEPCWYCVRKGRTAHWIGDRKQTTLWEIDKPIKSETGHSTQKPIECMMKPIQNHESEFVYEPFSGSGTTMIACEQLDRKCLAIELNPAYVAVTLERWSTLTDQQPVKL
jgi:DNA modification methylase